MAKDRAKKFKWRGMITILLLLAILVDIITGIVLFITPAGSVARWTSWTFLSLSKDKWTSIHIIFSLLLIVILSGHLYFNWRVLVHFLWDKVRNVVNLKRELAVASVIILILFFGTVWNVAPFNSIISYREDLKRNGDNHAGRGLGRGNSENLLSRQNQSSIYGLNNHYDYENNVPGDRFERTQYGGRGQGLGRRAYVQSVDTGSTLKGRDYVQIGQLKSLEGTLVRLGDEWGLKVGETVYEIHMGPSEYRASKGFVLSEGEMAHVKGFVSGTDIAVTTMETGGKSITLRDETGRAAWSGSSFSRGGAYNRSY